MLVEAMPPGRMIDVDPRFPVAERFPQKEEVIEQLVMATSHTASEVSEYLHEHPVIPIDHPDFDPIKIGMDNKAAEVLRRSFLSSPFVINAVASEGKKDEEKTGLHVDTVIGTFGDGQEFETLEEVPGALSERLSLANDPVEGTDSAMLREPGAISIVGVSTVGRVGSTPNGIKYMDKLVGPPELNGFIHLDAGATANLAQAVRILGVRPDQIDVVGLNRPRNFELRDEVTRFGAKWVGIKRGDLVPGLLAIQELGQGGEDERITLEMGIGGYDEGIINAIGARATGGVMMGRAWHEDINIRDRFHDLLGPLNLAGESEHSIVVFSAITDEPLFKLPGVRQEGKNRLVHSLVLDSDGVHKYLHSIPLKSTD